MPTRLASLVASAAVSSTRTRLTAFALVAAAGGVAFYAAPARQAAVQPAQQQARPAVLPLAAAPVTEQAPEQPATAPRRIYPYSIVPGGVADRAELAQAIKADKVVADHYAGFDVDKARPVTVAKPRAVYVSYRKDDKVYWTKKKLMLAEGETLLTDGVNELRARCANRISDTPMLPVSADEPRQLEFDSSIEEGSIVNTSAEVIEDEGCAAQPNPHKTCASTAADAPPAAPRAPRDRFRFSRMGQWEGSPLMFSTSQLSTSSTSETSSAPPVDTSRSTTSPEPSAPPVSTEAEPGLPKPEQPQEDPSPFIPAPPLLQLEQPELPYRGDETRLADVPEPSTLWLGGLAGAAMFLRRRTRRSARRD